MKPYNKDEVMKILARRERKMYEYYKSVFEDGFEGGYPASNDDEIIEYLYNIQKKNKEIAVEINGRVFTLVDSIGFGGTGMTTKSGDYCGQYKIVAVMAGEQYPIKLL